MITRSIISISVATKAKPRLFTMLESCLLLTMGFLYEGEIYLRIYLLPFLSTSAAAKASPIRLRILALPR